MIVVYITYPDKKEAEAIGHDIVQRRMAACYNVFPIRSSYWWNEHIESDDEFVSLVKTLPGAWEDIKNFVTEHHSYDVPCLIRINVEANDSYLDWLKSQIDERYH